MLFVHSQYKKNDKQYDFWISNKSQEILLLLKNFGSVIEVNKILQFIKEKYKDKYRYPIKAKMENFALNIDIIRGINISNKIPKALFVYIIEQIIKFTKNQNNEFDKNQLTEICQTEVPELKEEEIHQVLDSFVNISRYGAKKELTGKNMQSFLKDNTLIEEEKMGIFVNQFQTEISEKSLIKMINLGKLIDLKWNVCSFLSDQKNKDINKIYVKLELTVQTNSGELIHESFVLSLQEFKAFKEIISEISIASEQYNS